MTSISDVSSNISNLIGRRLKKNKEEIEVINYGLFFILHNLFTLIATVIIGILMGILKEIIIITIVSAMFKRYSGGIHASSPERCTIIGIIVASSLSLLSRYCVNNLDSNTIILLIVTSFIFSCFILYKKCPVVSNNKPLKIEIKNKLRKKAFILTTILMITEIILYLLYVSYGFKLISTIIVCVLLGMLVQVFVLIKPGRALIQQFDNLLKIVI